MKRVIFILQMLLSAIAMEGQSLQVRSFVLDQKDLTALNQETQVIDDNGRACALIRIETTIKGFAFDGGTIGVARVEEAHVGEVWVYVPATLRRITIRHSLYGTLKDYVFPEPLHEAATYYMELVTNGENLPPQVSDMRQQYLTIEVTPANALVQIDSTTVTTDKEGLATKFVTVGRHYYRVSANGYHPEAGYVVVDGSEKRGVKVSLRPAYGWLTVTSDDKIIGADVYVDDSKVGSVPLDKMRLNSGVHNVRIVKPLYRDYTKQVTITDGNEYKLPVTLAENYAKIKMTVSDETSIYINGQYMGHGAWQGALEAGEYLLETRRQNHRPQSRQITVRAAGDQVIALPEPTPIYGTVNVFTKPNNAQIKIDGHVVGMTPELLNNVLVGQHKLEISKEGYGDLSEDINVEEGRTLDVGGELNDMMNVTLSCNVENAEWSIDGIPVGRGKAITRKLPLGRHRVTIQAARYEYFAREFDVSQGINRLEFTMKPIERQRNTYTYTYTQPRKKRYEAYYDFVAEQGKYDVSIYTFGISVLYGWSMDLSVLDFRLGPIGFRPVNFMLQASPTFSELGICYTPMAQVFFPVSAKGAVTISGGATFDLVNAGNIGYIGQLGYTTHYSICASEFFFRASNGYYTIGCTLNLHVKK